MHVNTPLYRRIPRALSLLLAGLLLSVFCGSGVTDDSPRITKATFGFRNRSRPDRWTPALVQVKNAGPAGRFEVVAYDDTSDPRTYYRRTVWLPADSSRRVHMLLRPTTAETITFEVRQGQTVLSSLGKQPWLGSPRDAIVLALGAMNEEFGFDQTAENRPGGRLVRFLNVGDTSGLPERWLGYDAVDCILVSSLERDALSAAQQRAILRWVQLGGMLILTPETHAEWLADSFLAPLCPVEPSRRRMLEDVTPLIEAFGPGIPKGTRVPVWESEVIRGDVLLRAGDIPLIVVSRHGAGTVFFVAPVLTDVSLHQWRNVGHLYWRLLNMRDPLNALNRTALPGRTPELLLRMVGARVPTRTFVAVVLAVNIIIFAAACVWARRRKRPELAWGLAVVVAAIAAVVVYAMAAALSGVSGPGVAALSVAHGAAGMSPARVTSYFGIINVDTGRVSAGIDGDASAFPIPTDMPHHGQGEVGGGQYSVDFEDGDIKRLHNIVLRQRSMVPLEITRSASDFGIIEGSATPGPDGIRVRVRNASSRVIRKAFVGCNRNFTGIPDLAPGTEVEVVLDDTSGLATPAEFSRSLIKGERELLQDEFLRALFARHYADMGDEQVRVYGWLDDGGLPASVAEALGENTLFREQTLWIVDLPWEQPAGEVHLPKGVARGFPAQSPMAAFRRGRWDRLSGTHTVEIAFRVPRAVRTLRPTEMNVFFSTVGGRAKVRLEVWNNRAAAWQVLPFRSGDRKISVGAPQDIFEPSSGAVRVRARVSSAADAMQLNLGEQVPVIADFDFSLKGTVQ